MQDGLAHFDSMRPRRFRIKMQDFGDILGCNRVELVAGNRSRFYAAMRMPYRRTRSLMPGWHKHLTSKLLNGLRHQKADFCR